MKSWAYLFLVCFVILIGFSACEKKVEAGNFDIGFVSSASISDMTGYLRDFHGDAEARVGVGISSPLVTLSYKGAWVADIASLCGVGTAATSGDTSFSSGIGMCTNLKGLRLGAMYDPIQGKPLWMVGLSLAGAADQLLK